MRTDELLPCSYQKLNCTSLPTFSYHVVRVLSLSNTKRCFPTSRSLKAAVTLVNLYTTLLWAAKDHTLSFFTLNPFCGCRFHWRFFRLLFPCDGRGTEDTSQYVRTAERLVNPKVRRASPVMALKRPFRVRHCRPAKR